MFSVLIITGILFYIKNILVVENQVYIKSD